jgi:hypothetical protein
MAASKRRSWLEVRQWWNDLMLEARHFRAGEGVTLGDELGWRWFFLGVDMGFVSPTMAKVLPFTPPIWSEVRATPRTDFVAGDDVVLGSEALLRWAEDRWWLVPHPDATFWIDGEEVADPRQRLVSTEAGRLLAMPEDGEVVVALGAFHFEVRQVAGAAAQERSAVSPEWGYAAMLGSFMAMAALLVTVVVFSPPPAEISLIEAMDDEIVVQMLRRQPPPPKTEPLSKAPAAPKAQKAERPKKGKRPERTPQGTPDADREEVLNAGILGAMQNEALAGILGDGSLGEDLLVGINGLLAAKGGGGPGRNGLSGRGGSLGGGGPVAGIGNDMWGEGGPPSGDIGITVREAGVLPAAESDVLMVGSLSPSVVDEVVRRHLASLRYCYVRHLNADPSLSGKVVTRFSIAADGTVSSAHTKRSTVAHAGVEQCVAGHFLRMQFPPPAGGGVVLVNYPLVFSRG